MEVGTDHDVLLLTEELVSIETKRGRLVFLKGMISV